MKSEWKSVKLGDYCSKIGSGSTPRGGSSVYLESGKYSLFRSQNILNNAFSSNGLVYIDTEAAEKLKNVSVEENDVLLNITGDSVARVCKAPSEYLPARVNQHVAIIRTKQNELNSSYVNYYLNSKSMQNYMLSIASAGATRNALTKVMIENFEIPKPPLSTQKKIAHILSTLDDKIELNRKMNQTLEEMAQALFKSWFVDFDPVHANAKAKSEEELEITASQLGISKEILDLFPSEFEENETGMIPRGWNIYQLEMVSSLFAGGDKPKNTTKAETVVNNIPIYSNGIKDEGLYGFTDTPKILEESVTVSARGTIGFVCLRFKPYVPIVRLISVVPNQNYLSSKYLYFWLKSQKISGFGTTQQQLTIPVFKQMKITIPPIAIMSAFSKRADIIYEKIQNNSSQTQTLQKTRDTLLPKLLSGELDVSNIHIGLDNEV